MLIAGGAVAVLTSTRNGPPAALSVQGQTIVVSDQSGRELWRKTLDKPLQPGLQVRLSTPQSHIWPLSWIGDLDNDGQNEVLLVHAFRQNESTGSTPLVCYTDRGIEKWRFLPGRSVGTLPEHFSPIYNTWQIAVISLRDGSKAVLVSSPHYRLYPHQIALLSARGELLREYWHSGQLYRMEVADADGDGRSDIYLAGINNAAKSATLIVLDPENFGGASVEENNDYQLQDFPLARERGRILFHRTCIARAWQTWSSVNELWVKPGEIKLAIAEGRSDASILYRLTGDLALQDYTLSEGFRSHHKELEAAGKLDHPFTPREESELRNLRYLVRPPARAAR